MKEGVTLKAYIDSHGLHSRENGELECAMCFLQDIA